MRGRGVTLVELLVVLAVGAILVTISIPGYAFLVNANRLTAVTNDLVMALHMARSEAIKRGMRVTVCKTSNPMAALPSCDSAATWQQGWLIFSDDVTRGVIDPGDSVLWIQDSAHSTVSITTHNYSSHISYLPAGGSRGSNNLANGTIQICVAGSRRDIIINITGRPRLEDGIC
jgi:type IV fimbrial biogenesis protein FimT